MKILLWVSVIAFGIAFLGAANVFSGINVEAFGWGGALAFVADIIVGDRATYPIKRRAQ